LGLSLEFALCSHLIIYLIKFVSFVLAKSPLHLSKNLADKFMDVIPHAMHLVRSEVRSHTGQGMGLTQFRILANINRGLKHTSEIAKHHGISQAAMSKHVDSLVKAGFINRENDSQDRRLYTLKLTSKGLKEFKRIKKLAGLSLNQKLTFLSDKDIENLYDSLDILMKFVDGFKQK